MTLVTTCISCQYGDHDGHTPVISPGTPGLIGSRTECGCKGECFQPASPLEPNAHGFAFLTWDATLADAQAGIDHAYERRRGIFQAAREAGLSLRTIADAVGLSPAAVHKIVGRDEPRKSQADLLKEVPS